MNDRIHIHVDEESPSVRFLNSLKCKRGAWTRGAMAMRYETALRAYRELREEYEISGIVGYMMMDVGDDRVLLLQREAKDLGVGPVELCQQLEEMK